MIYYTINAINLHLKVFITTHHPTLQPAYVPMCLGFASAWSRYLKPGEDRTYDNDRRSLAKKKRPLPHRNSLLYWNRFLSLLRRERLSNRTGGRGVGFTVGNCDVDKHPKASSNISWHVSFFFAALLLSTFPVTRKRRDFSRYLKSHHYYNRDRQPRLTKLHQHASGGNGYHRWLGVVLHITPGMYQQLSNCYLVLFWPIDVVHGPNRGIPSIGNSRYNVFF